MLKIIVTILFIILVAFQSLPVRAQSYDPNYLISDYEFTDWTTMTMKEVENFLKSKGSSLVRYVDARTRQLASQIIFDAAVIYQVNPKVLLTLLQKEQSLIEDASPAQDQYDWATGFGVCDSCAKNDPALAPLRGFATQVDRAAWRFRYYLTNPQEFRFRTGASYEIDGSPVTMTNDATRALYTYTPHLHGNENFVNIWRRWFAKLYPDGAVLQDEQTKSLWLIQNGRRRRIASHAVAASRTDLSRLIRVSPLDLQRYDEGDPITFAQYSLLRSPRGTVYLLVDDAKRGFASRDAFRTLGFNPEEVENAGWDVLNTIPDGPPITIQSSYPTGALIQDTTTGGIWYIQDGIKHALIARELLARFKGTALQKAKPDQLAQFALGSPLKLTDGTLMQNMLSGEVAVTANGERRSFTSVEAMVKLGYKKELIISVPEKVWNLHPAGAVMEAPFAELSSTSGQ
jgi:hypothetical protein